VLSLGANLHLGILIEHFLFALRLHHLTGELFLCMAIESFPLQNRVSVLAALLLPLSYYYLCLIIMVVLLLLPRWHICNGCCNLTLCYGIYVMAVVI
jgi:hypothetical protein